MQSSVASMRKIPKTVFSRHRAGLIFCGYQMAPVFAMTAVLLGRSIALALQYGLRAELLLTMSAARRLGIGALENAIQKELQLAERLAVFADEAAGFNGGNV